MSPERESLTGSVLDGRYRIDSLLGEGGMGVVYSATDLRLEKRVAVKVMSRDLAGKAEILARFHREARVTSGLGHPHIVQVFDSSAAPTGEPFLVMEFLEGEDLDRRLRRKGRLTPQETLHIVKQVAAALMATHGKGIVHRDLKPANIYLLEAAGAGDFVKVLDFGISKIASASTKLTRTMAIVGTPNYMSPEQAEGKNEDIDERTDQWALACIAWECLAGEMLFAGDSTTSILLQIVNKPPQSLLAKAPDLHPQIEDVLLRALARSKSDRFLSVNDFAVALEAAISGTASVALPNRSPTVQVTKTAVDIGDSERALPASTFTKTAGELGSALDASAKRSRAWAWGLVVGAAVLLALGVFLVLRPTASPKPAAASLAPAAPTPRPAVPPPSVLAEPPTAAPAVAAPEPLLPPPEAETVPPPPQVKPARLTVAPEPKPKRAKRRAAPQPKVEAPGAGGEPPQQPVPQPRKESQDRWRLD